MLGDIIDRIATGPVAQTGFASYQDFLSSLESDPAYLEAQAVVSQGPKSTSYFAPPSLFHMVARKQHTALLGLDYIAHGFHTSLVKPPAALVDEEPPAGETPVPWVGYACRDLSGEGKADYSMYQCVDDADPSFSTSRCAGHTVVGYCDGSANIKCCLVANKL
jgi:hypothetical protein